MVVRILIAALLTALVTTAGAQLSTLGVGPASQGSIQTPAQIFGANLFLWHKADAGVFVDAGVTPATNGQTVQQWNDQSGNGNNLLQATAGNRPTFLSAGLGGFPTISCAAASTNAMLTAVGTVALTTNIHAGFFVGQMNGAAGSFARAITFSGAFANDNNPSGMIWAERVGVTNAIQGLHGATGAIGPQAVSLATTVRWGTVADGVNTTTYLNNVASAPVADNQTGGTGVAGVCSSIVNNQVQSAPYWDGPISEVVVVKGVAPSASDRSNLDNYFKNKWGL